MRNLKRERDRDGKKQKRLKGREGRQGMAVTAQLMPGHEMALPPIMTERALENETEGREAKAVISTGC